MRKKKKTKRNSIFLLYPLISITLLVFSSASNSLSPIVTMPSSYDSVQQANARTMTAELTSLGDPSSFSPSAQQLPTGAATLTNKFMTYENPTYGITIQYPSNWEKIEYPRIGLGAVGNDLVVNFLAPLVNASDHWREHLMIQVLKQTQAKKLIPYSETTLGGRHGYERVYNNSMEILNLDRNTEVRLHLKTMEIWITISNGDAYLVTYKAVAARYSHYLPTIQKMLDSFKITNSTTY